MYRALLILAALSFAPSAAKADPCYEGWKGLLVRPHAPIDPRERALAGFLRLPNRESPRWRRALVSAVQFAPRGISYAATGRAYDFIPFQRAAELALDPFFAAGGRAITGRPVRAGALPVFALGTGLSYLAVDTPLTMVEDAGYKDLLANSAPFSEIRYLREKGKISHRQAMRLAAAVESALESFYERVEAEDWNEASPEKLRGLFRDPRLTPLVHHLPDLLDHNFKKVAPELEAIPGAPKRTRPEEELALHQINHRLLLEWSYIPTLVGDILKNKELLGREPGLFFDLKANAGRLELAEATRELLENPPGKVFVDGLTQNPFLLALAEITARGEADREDLVYSLQKLSQYRARLEEYGAVGAQWNLGGRPLTEDDYYKPLIDEMRARRAKRIPQK